jgi:hypothetical protein
MKNGSANVSFVTDAVNMESKLAVVKRSEATQAIFALLVIFSTITNKNRAVKEEARGIIMGIITIGGKFKINDDTDPNRLAAGQ